MTLAPLNAATPLTSPQPVYTAPTRAGRALLGRTLPSLLDEACTNNPNPRAFNEPSSSGWQAVSSESFREESEALALALHDLGFNNGDRVAFFTHSDLSFCLPDMACLMAGLVSVPLYLTECAEAVQFILQETAAELLVVSDAALLEKVTPLLGDTAVHTILLRDPTGAQTPAGVTVYSFAELSQRGEALAQAQPGAAKALRRRVQADDLATIVYTSGTTGTPKGVMLSHENLSSNVLAAFSGIPELRRGHEVALSFLPLTHIFARTLHYGYLAWGAAVYFTTPEKLRAHLTEVRPTTFATVPQVLERVFEGILKAGAELGGVKKPIFDWAVALARRFDPEQGEKVFYSSQRRAAAKLVFDRWREALGGRLKLVAVGGAALRPELVRVFGAAEVAVLQGYGLTETGPILAFNRPDHNRPGTVGELLAGVEIKRAQGGELLTRGPQVMKGYYNNPEATTEAIDQDGWFSTGDSGEMSSDGFLTITGRLKNIFGLSTGKFVTPQPLEGGLEASPHIEYALVVGEGEKFCAVLLFLGPGSEPESVKDELVTFIRSVNETLPPWSRAKHALLLSEPLSVENNLLTPTLKVKRKEVLEVYKARVAALFEPITEGAGDARMVEVER